MMNLKEIQAFQGNLSQQKQVRAERGEAAFNAGLDLLEQYNRTPGREVLLQAMGKFIECMGQQRDRVEPVALLAYIYYALKSPQLAARYYRLAAGIDAQAPQVKRLQAILTRQDRIPTIAEARGQASTASEEFSLLDLDPDGEVDLDALYDEVEALTQQELQRLVARPLTMAPALEPGSRALLVKQQDELGDLLAGLRSQLDLLDEEIDVQPLQTRLHPFEVRLKQLQRLIEASSQASEIMAQIAAVQAVTEAELARDVLSEQALDPLLDQCDLLADKIDVLDKQGFEIQALEAAYNSFVGLLTRFQDQLEDAEAC